MSIKILKTNELPKVNLKAKTSAVLEFFSDYLTKYKIDQKVFAGMIGKSEITVSRWVNSKIKLTEANIILILSWIENDMKKRYNLYSKEALEIEMKYFFNKKNNSKNKELAKLYAHAWHIITIFHDDKKEIDKNSPEWQDIQKFAEFMRQTAAEKNLEDTPVTQEELQEFAENMKKKYSGVLQIAESHPEYKPRDEARPIRPGELHQVPIIGIAQASGYDYTLEQFDRYATENALGFAPVVGNTDGILAIKIDGDSMSPWYPDGTVVVISCKELPEHGKRVVAKLRDTGEVVFKVFLRDGKSVKLVSINGKGKDFEWNNPSDNPFWWIYPVKVSVRNEDDLDFQMDLNGIRHRWEKKIGITPLTQLKEIAENADLQAEEKKELIHLLSSLEMKREIKNKKANKK